MNYLAPGRHYKKRELQDSISHDHGGQTHNKIAIGHFGAPVGASTKDPELHSDLKVKNGCFPPNRFYQTLYWRS